MKQPASWEKVLIVDDEPSILHLVERSLARKGHVVQSASSALEALELLQGERFHLLLADIVMPGMDGLELLKRAQTIDPEMAIAIITGYPTLEYTIQCLKLGVDGFVVKPFTPEELLAELEETVQRSYHKRERARLRALAPLADASGCPVAETDLRIMVTAMVDTLLKEPGKDKASLIIFDEENDTVLCKLSPKGVEPATGSPMSQPFAFPAPQP